MIHYFFSYLFWEFLYKHDVFKLQLINGSQPSQPSQPPPGLLVAKLGEMECGQFVGKAAIKY
jgi:hypothetical protein